MKTVMFAGIFVVHYQRLKIIISECFNIIYQNINICVHYILNFIVYVLCIE